MYKLVVLLLAWMAHGLQRYGPYGPECNMSMSGRYYRCNDHNATYSITVNSNNVEIECKEGDLICNNSSKTEPLASDCELNMLTVKFCNLIPFDCLLRRVKACGTRALYLIEPRGNLTEDLVKGLESTKQLTVERPQTSFSLNAVLPHLPSLDDARIFRGHLTLTPALRHSTLFSGTFQRPWWKQRVLYRNKIEELETGAFDGIDHLTFTPALRHSNLTVLNLTDDRITRLPPGTFQLPRLKQLVLDNNEIEELEAGAFDGLPSLQHLSMSANPLKELHAAALAPLVNLATLTVKHHRLQWLRGDAFRNMMRLGMVHIMEMLTNDNRQTLHLEAGVFSNLPSLSNISTSNTPLAPLPEDLFRGSENLMRLLMDGGRLEQVPVTLFRDQRKLEHLNLSNNFIQVLSPELLRPLVNLQELDLSNNRIEVIESNVFNSQTELQKLNLNGNRIREIQGGSFIGPNKLLELSLSHNELSLCRPSHPSRECSTPLKSLDYLRRLDLSHNRIGSIALEWRGIFLHDIEYIDLSYNNVTLLKNDDLQFFGSNLTIDLRHNNISTIDDELDFDVNLEQKFLLAHNPFTCDCRLYPLLKYTRYHTRPIFEFASTNCASPASLQSEALDSMPLMELTCEIPDCPPSCKCKSIPAISTLELNCSKPLSITEYPAPNINNLTQTKLILREKFDKISLPEHVTSINLSGLGLTTVPALPRTLTQIDLSYNSLKTIPKYITDLQATLYIGGNHLDCCSYLEDVEALMFNMKRNKIIDSDNVFCNTNTSLFEAFIDVKNECESNMATYIIIISIFLVFVMSIGICYSADKIQLCMYNLGFNTFIYEDEVDGKIYDAVISSADEDVVFVATVLIPQLESMGYKVWARHRDTLPGDFFPEKIAEAVAKCRRVIAVNSKYYKSDVIAEIEYKAAKLVEAKGKRKMVLETDVTDTDWNRLKKEMPRRRKGNVAKLQRSKLNVMFTNDGTKVDFRYEKTKPDARTVIRKKEDV